MAEIVEISRGDAPLLLSIPHTGTIIPPDIEANLVSGWLARKDTDWRIEQLYAFAADLGATILRATHSRTVIDVNRDPSGASLYPGQATTGLCPTKTFDGEALYKADRAPDTFEIERRKRLFFQPYHTALTSELTRLKEKHPRIVLYDCHSIRSVVPRLFEGELPHMNIGTNSGARCDPAFAHVIQTVCDASGFSWVSNARFKGGWITRNHGRPALGIHAIQMELACRSYLNEPIPEVDETNWPPPYDEGKAGEMRVTLGRIFKACLAFSRRAES